MSDLKPTQEEKPAVVVVSRKRQLNNEMEKSESEKEDHLKVTRSKNTKSGLVYVSTASTCYEKSTCEYINDGRGDDLVNTRETKFDVKAFLYNFVAKYFQGNSEVEMKE
jgi:hypothetical protein